MINRKSKQIPKNPEFRGDPVDDKRVLDGVVAGDPEAGRDFIVKWGRLAHDLGRRAARGTRGSDYEGIVTVEDLTQDAYELMLKDARNYSSDGGASFATYTRSFMPQRLSTKRFEAEYGAGIPMNAQEMLNAIDAENDARINQGYHYMTDDEIAKMFNMPLTHGELKPGEARITVSDLHDARGISKFIGSIDEQGFAPNSDETPGQGYDVSDIRPMQSVAANVPKTTEEIANENALRQKMDEVLDTLGERERAIVKSYYGYDDNTPLIEEEIGEKFGITRERVRQILSKAHSKLRHASKKDVLREFTKD